MTLDKFRIGGKSTNYVTRRVAVGCTIDGWMDVVPSAQKDSLETVLHLAEVRMPYMYVGTPREQAVWQRDAILGHYGLHV